MELLAVKTADDPSWMPVLECSKPPNPLDQSTHFPGISSFSKQNELGFFFSPSGLFVCFGIEHTENKTSPACPARLVPEPAGENIEIGWTSGWPLAPGPRGPAAGCRSSTGWLFAKPGFYSSTARCFQNNPTHPKPMLIFVQMLVHPLSQQQPC